MLTSINPATGQPIAQYELHTASDVDAALTEAVSAQAVWRETAIEDRCDLLRRVAAVLRKGSGVYARLITNEMGKPISEAESEIEKCAWTCEFYAEKAPHFLADEIVESSAADSRIVFDPLGVILAIMPWNYPFWQFFRFAAPALAAGNGSILKHANNVPGCALAIEEALRDAGCPDGLARTLLIDSGRVAPIIADDRIAAVTLTGSTEVGSIVASQAGRALKKQVLELGGSDPFIVLKDADIEEAARIAVKARFSNAGQACISAKRFIVEDAVADAFVAAFCKGVSALAMGDPAERTTTIGPMARANLRDDLHVQVQRTIAAGAKLVVGGNISGEPGYFYPPTVLDHVRPDMVAFCEETFGPVAAIIRVKSAEEAVDLANRTEFGLGASLWTENLAAARRISRRINAGAVFINAMVSSDPRLPFGGVKRSGYGRELGVFGVREFVNIKTVWTGEARGS